MAVITGVETDSVYESEWFYISFSGPNYKIRSRRFRIEKEIKYATGIEDLWRNSVVDDLKNSIDVDLIIPEIEKNNKYTLFARDYDIHGCENSKLLSIRTKYKEFIDYIKKHIRSDRLKNYIELINGIKLHYEEM